MSPPKKTITHPQFPVVDPERQAAEDRMARREAEEHTPVNSSMPEVTAFRLKSLEVQQALTTQKIEHLTLTTAQKIDQLDTRNDQRFDTVDKNITAINTSMLALTKESSGTSATVAGIAKTLDAQLQLQVAERVADTQIHAAQRVSSVETSTKTTITKTEVEGLRAKTEIEDAADRKKKTREIAVKLLAIVAAIWATVSTALHC